MDELAKLFVRLALDASEYTRALRSQLGKATTFGQQLGSRLGNSMARAFRIGLAVVLAGIASIATASIGAAISFEQQMSGVQAVLGETAEVAKQLSDQALELSLSPDLVVDATQAAGAMELLARNGVNATDILDGMARSSILLTNATVGVGAVTGDFANAADILTDSMALFGITAADAESAVDSITGVTNNSKLSLESYRFALAGVGGVAADMGLSLEDMNAALALAAPSFADGSTLGNGFKSFLNQLIPTTKKATSLMTDLGLVTADGGSSFFDAQGNMKPFNEIINILNQSMLDLTDEQRVSTLKQLFGARGQIFASAMIDNGRDMVDVFNDMSAAVNRTGQAQENVEIRVDNLAGAWAIFSSIVGGMAIQIGNVLLPFLNQFLNWVNAFVSDNAPALVQAFENIVGIIETFVADISDVGIREALENLFANLGIDQQILDTLFGVFDWVVENQSAIIGAIEGIAVAFGALIIIGQIARMISLITNPLSWLIVLAGFLGAAWRTNFADIQGLVFGLWEAVQEAFEGIKLLLEGDLEGALEAFRGAWETAWAAISDFVSNIWGMVEPHLTAFWGNISSWFSDQNWQEIGQNVIDSIILGFSTFVDKAEEQLSTWEQSFLDWADAGSWDEVGEMVANGIVAGFQESNNQIESVLQEWEGAILGWAGASSWDEIGKDVVTLIIDGLESEFSTKVGEVLASWGESIANWAGTDSSGFFVIGAAVVSRILEGFTATASETLDTLSTWTDSISEWIAGVDWQQIGHDITLHIITGLAGAGVLFEVTLTAWRQGIIDWASDVENWKSIGQSIIDGIMSGFIFTATVKQAITDFFMGMIDAVKEVLGIASPSIVFMQIGRDVVQGFIDGAMQLLESARAFGLNLLTSIKDGIVENAEILTTAFLGLWEQWTTVWWPQISTAVTDAWLIIESIFLSILDWIMVQIMPTVELFRALWVDVAWPAIQEAVAAAWGIIQPIFEKIQEWLETIQTVVDNARAAFVAAWDAISGAISSAYNATIKPIFDAIRNFWDWLSSTTFSFDFSIPDLPSWMQTNSPMVLHTRMRDFKRFLDTNTFEPDFGALENLLDFDSTVTGIQDALNNFDATVAVSGTNQETTDSTAAGNVFQFNEGAIVIQLDASDVEDPDSFAEFLADRIVEAAT